MILEDLDGLSSRRNEFTQAPANRNRAVVFPSELKF